MKNALLLDCDGQVKTVRFFLYRQAKVSSVKKARVKIFYQRYKRSEPNIPLGNNIKGIDTDM